MSAECSQSCSVRGLLLVRHGQSEHHVQDLTGGWTDTPLTELGRQQAELLAARLPDVIGELPARLYCSDLLRAMQTAQIVGRALGLEPILEPGLREINNGVAAGLTREAAHALRAPPTEPLLDWCPYPGGESWRAFHRRVAACMEELTRNQQEVLILVSHGGTITQQVAWWLQLGWDTLQNAWFDAYPASLTVLRINKWQNRTIERLNDTAHLHAAGLVQAVRLDQR